MENSNLIHHLAHTFQNTTGIDYDELFCEARLAYLSAERSFQKDKGVKLTTYAYTCMKNHLINFCKQETRFSQNTSLYESLPSYLHPKEELKEDFDLAEYATSWPKEYKEIAAIVLEDPDRFLSQTPNFKGCGPVKARLREELRDRGWLHLDIEQAFRDLKALV